MSYYYVYRITNTKLRKHYYGKRKSELTPKDDIGIKYFSSSRDKVFMKDQKDNPQNYKYKVLRTFDCSDKAANFEIKIHNRLDVARNQCFYNLAKQTSFKFDTTGVPSPKRGVPLSKSTKEKLSKAFKGRKLTEKHKQSIGDGVRGYKHTEGAKLNMSIAQSTRKRTENDKEAKRGSKNPKARKVICIETNEVFQTITEAAKAVGANSVSTITNALNGRCKTSKGYHWAYINN